MTPRTVAYCIRVHCLHLLCIAKVMTCSCPRGRTTDQLAAYTRSRQLSHFAAPRKPARVHARPLQPSTASNHSRVQRLSTRSTTSPSASAARADAPADAPATPEPSALSTGEAEVLISQSSRSWQSMAEFLTAHSCHIPANVVPQLCAALLRLCSHPAVADPTARRAPSATPFQRYPEPLKELLQAAGACSITDGTFTARTRGQSNARSTEASALMQKAQNGDMSDNEEPTSVEQGVSEWAPVERSLRDALHWEHDSQTWGASPHSHSEQGTRSRPAPHTHQDSSQLQADAQGGSAVSDARPASGAGSTPDTARRRRVWHADSAALQPHGEAARRVLLLLVSAVSTPTTHLHPSRIADPLQTALLAAVLCEVSACVGAGRAGSSTQHWGRYTPPHRQPSFALFASVRSAVLALVQSAVQGFDSPLAQITDTWEPQNSLAPLAARASMALAVVSLSLGPSQARDGDQCVTYAEWDSLVEPCAALMDTQRMQQQRQVAAACCAALLWCEAVLAHASSNGSEGPTSHMDRCVCVRWGSACKYSCSTLLHCLLVCPNGQLGNEHIRCLRRHWAPLLARLTPQYLRSPTQTLDCVWAVTTRLPNTAAHTTDTTEDTEGTGVTAQPSGAKTSVKANAWAHAPMQAMMAYTVLHPSRPAPLVLEQLLRSLITCQVATTATGKPKKEPGVWRCRLSAAETVVLLCCLAQVRVCMHASTTQS